MEKQMEPLVPAENELDNGIEIEIVPDEIPDDIDVWTEEIISSLEPDFNENLAEDMDERAMQSISSDILDMIRTDLDARRDWEKTYSEGVKLLGLKMEERTEPWDGACGVFHPLLTEAVVRFQSETILSTFPAHGPVKTQIVGKITKQKEEAANRVQTDMNYELTEKMVEYRSEHERLLWSLPKGHIEAGETPEMAAIREVQEETGIQSEISRALGVIDFWFMAGGKRIHKTVHHYLFKETGGNLQAQIEEVDEVGWFPLEEIVSMLAYPDEKKLIAKSGELTL